MCAMLSGMFIGSDNRKVVLVYNTKSVSFTLLVRLSKLKIFFAFKGPLKSFLDMISN